MNVGVNQCQVWLRSLGNEVVFCKRNVFLSVVLTSLCVCFDLTSLIP